MRIGERLIHDQIITPEQLDEGLRVQVLQGGRIGTNLVELGYLDSDTLTEYLGRHHGMPVATDKHFELASAELQARLPAALAAEWGAVPMGLLVGSQGANPHIAVAVMDPLPERAIDRIATALGGQIVLVVASELRLRQHLEQAYGVPRSSRFNAPPVLPTLAEPSDDEAQCDILVHIDGEDMSDSKLENLAMDQMGDDQAGNDQAGNDQAGNDQAGNNQAGNNQTAAGQITDSAPGPTEPAAAHGLPGLDPDSRQDDSAPATAQLARIAIKRVSTAHALATEPPAPEAPTTLQEVVRAIRRATGRDRVGDLVVGAMRDLFDGAFDVGAILVVREGIAVGWKGFVRHGHDEIIEAVALPLNTPSVVYRAHDTRQLFIGPPPEGGTNLDRRLWKLLRSHVPATVAVAPVVLEDQTVCLLYGHIHGSMQDGDQDAAALGDSLATLARATGKAFIRLIRAAQR